MKKFLEIVLAGYARLALKLHKPKIIGITGSVGKSSTKDAIALVLAKKFRVGASGGNLNSQLGLPLAILGFPKAGGFKRNIATFFQWLWIVIAGFFRIFNFNYPKILILEMGSDKPGDLAYLLTIVGKLDVAVITDIGISHLEFFPSPNALANEKLSLLKGLGKNGIAVLNADNPKVLDGQNKTKAKVVTYGFTSGEIQAQNFQITEKNGQKGISFNITRDGARLPFFIPHAIGKPAAYAALAAVAAGISMDMNLVEISQALESYRQPTGRLRMIEGVNNTNIIDDTYNAALSSTIAAFEALSMITSARKIVAIGHMAELGPQSVAAHKEVGQKIMDSDFNLVFLIGDKTKVIEDELRSRNFAGKVFWFADSDQAKSVIKQNLIAGDWILVKGSQSARMEKIVKEIMADPKLAKELLVRQSRQWLKRK